MPDDADVLRRPDHTCSAKSTTRRRAEYATPCCSEATQSRDGPCDEVARRPNSKLAEHLSRHVARRSVASTPTTTTTTYDDQTATTRPGACRACTVQLLLRRHPERQRPLPRAPGGGLPRPRRRLHRPTRWCAFPRPWSAGRRRRSRARTARAARAPSTAPLRRHPDRQRPAWPRRRPTATARHQRHYRARPACGLRADDADPRPYQASAARARTARCIGDQGSHRICQASSATCLVLVRCIGRSGLVLVRADDAGLYVFRRGYYF